MLRGCLPRQVVGRRNPGNRSPKCSGPRLEFTPHLRRGAGETILRELFRRELDEMEEEQPPQKVGYEFLDFNFTDCCRPVRFGVVLLLPPIPDVGQSVFLATP